MYRLCIAPYLCHTHEWVTSYIWKSHITRINISCHKYEPFISFSRRAHCATCCATRSTPASHVTYMNGSCHIYKKVWISHATYMNCHSLSLGVRFARRAVQRALLPPHVTHMNESSQIYENVWISHVIYMNESHSVSRRAHRATSCATRSTPASCHIHECVMNKSCDMYERVTVSL